MAAASESRTAIVLEFINKEWQIKQRLPAGRRVWSALFSPDDTRILTAGQPEVRIFEESKKSSQNIGFGQKFKLPNNIGDTEWKLKETYKTLATFATWSHNGPQNYHKE